MWAFFINWFKIRLSFALENLATLSKHAFLNRRPADNRMIFLAVNRSPLLWYTVDVFFCLNNQRIFVLQLYIYMVLQLVVNRKSSSKRTSWLYLETPTLVNRYFQVLLAPPPPSINKIIAIQPNNSRFFSVQFSLGKFWLKFSSLGCLCSWQSLSLFLCVFVVCPRVLSWLRWSRFADNTVAFWERFKIY